MDKIAELLRGVFLLLLVLTAGCRNNYDRAARKTSISINGNSWFINDKIINEGSPAEGLLINVRMVNSVFEDIGKNLPGEFNKFDPEKNTESFISEIPEYVNHGVNAFTISLQGGSPGYEGAVNSAFEADGNLRNEYMERIAEVIRAVDNYNGVIILSCFYQRQHSHESALRGKGAILNALGNTVNWIKMNQFHNVLLEVSNEYKHGGYLKWIDGKWFISTKGQIELITLAKSIYPSLIVSTSGMGDGRMNDSLVKVADYITIHLNTTPLNDYAKRINELNSLGKPVMCNEDDKTGNAGASALVFSVINNCGWGYMNSRQNQYMPFRFEGSEDDTAVYNMMKKVTTAGYSIDKQAFPQSSMQ